VFADAGRRGPGGRTAEGSRRADGSARDSVPRATYRLQLHAGFDFDAAAGVADYIAALGVSHAYSSPYLQAAPGSLHGYDVVNPRQVNLELGGAVSHQRFSLSLGDRGLGQVLDIVPNHMAIGGDENPWWTDVLENGPASRYARYFDVDWDPIGSPLTNTVLLPVLGDHYGRILEGGELQLERDAGTFYVRYHERRFPVAPPSLEGLLVQAGFRAGADELVFIGSAMGALPPSSATDRESVVRRHRDKEVLRHQLARLLSDRPELAEVLDQEVAGLNTDFDRLDQLLEAQNYRLAFWRMAGQELGYRRFFDVSSLIGLRTEDEGVFRDTHELLLTWLREGVLDGLRVDHPDGLRDPRTYFARLRAASPSAWIVAEKILARDEQLPADWPINGTTGYDFMNRAGGLFVDPAGEEPLTRLYRDFTGSSESFDELAYRNKHRVMAELLAAELTRLTELAVTVVQGHRRNRDYSRAQLREALAEVIACLPVYRVYLRPAEGVVSADDIAYLDQAIGEARRRRGEELGVDLFTFLRDLLAGRHPGDAETELIHRFQQLSGAVMAKGVEDTTFYQYSRLVSLNEVGGEPGHFGVSLEEFHAAARRTQADWPTTMLSTATHDHKRGEDVRCRISVLSEMPDAWRSAVEEWSAMNKSKRTGNWPERNTEYFLYQTLVGAWPISLERLTAYMEKAVREAKTQTSWTDQDQRYERALRRFIERLLEDGEFIRSLELLLEKVVPTARTHSLSQTLLKLTSPGVPDIYQGTELWDLSLVDPDNRRPIDYDERRQLLDRARTAGAADVLGEAESGLPKLWLIQRVLDLRARRPELFGASSTYHELCAAGSRADHVVAYARGGEAVAVAQRLVHGLGGEWGDTTLRLPAGRWRDELGGDAFDGGEVPLKQLLAAFPVALLMPEPLG
jgi:(1->4)-alpha-D-glucan 1-alpha-D-glucosylmutase